MSNDNRENMTSILKHRGLIVLALKTSLFIILSILF